VQLTSPHGPRWQRNRRTACQAAAAAAIAVALPLPSACAADDDLKRLQRGLVDLDNLLLQWVDLTTDCRFGEIRRELLEANNKQQLLEEASSTSKASTTVTLCRTNAQVVRRAIGTSQPGPLSKIGALLQQPALIDSLVDDEAFEKYQETSERLQAAITAADAAAYSAGNDYSAQTTFKRGQKPSSPNLDRTRELVSEARDELVAVCKLLGLI
jgi:hypothetical protein